MALSTSCYARNVIADTAAFTILASCFAVAFGEVSDVFWSPFLFSGNRLVAMGRVVGIAVLCRVSAHAFESDPILELQVCAQRMLI